jgi:four helix bundle protein
MAMGAKNYRELIVWQRAIQLVKAIYKVSAGFPKEELYGLTSQIRRAAVSVPSNIAEGQARRTTGEFLHFLWQAEGSLAEADTQLILAVELGFVTPEGTMQASELLLECQRMLSALRTKLTTNH